MREYTPPSVTSDMWKRFERVQTRRKSDKDAVWKALQHVCSPEILSSILDVKLEDCVRIIVTPEHEHIGLPSSLKVRNRFLPVKRFIRII